jgi:hypothetical protein
VDFLDIAELFLGFTDQFLQKTYTEFDIVSSENEYPLLFLTLRSEKGLIEMTFEDGRTREEARVSINDGKNYVNVLRYLVRCILQR